MSDNGNAQPAKSPAAEARSGITARFAAAGMPAEHSRDFKGSARRLGAQLRPDRARVVAVLALAVASVSLMVVGPRILGAATNVIVDGVIAGTGVDFTRLGQLLGTATVLYLVSASMAWGQARLLADVVQRTMQRMRADVEAKLHRLPLGYVDRQPRGDLLSRVSNDSDNGAQSLQQTLSQIRTSTLTLVGGVIMGFTISPGVAASARGAITGSSL